MADNSDDEEPNNFATGSQDVGDPLLTRSLKIVVVGDSTSGKTSLCCRLAQDSFGKMYRQTVGLDFYVKRLRFSDKSQDDLTLTAQIWDVGGQSLNGGMLDKYVYGAHGVLLVYDITSRQSFEAVASWLESIRKFAIDSSKQPQIFLVANKTDLEHLRAVHMDEHLNFARKNQLSSVLVSAKTGDSVDLCFQKIVADILGLKMTKNEMEQQIGVVKAQIPSTSSSSGRVNYARSQSQVSSATAVKTPVPVNAAAMKTLNSNVCCVQ